jgi:hypothetical protein
MQVAGTRFTLTCKRDCVALPSFKGRDYTVQDTRCMTIDLTSPRFSLIFRQPPGMSPKQVLSRASHTAGVAE